MARQQCSWVVWSLATIKEERSSPWERKRGPPGSELGRSSGTLPIAAAGREAPPWIPAWLSAASLDWVWRTSEQTLVRLPCHRLNCEWLMIRYVDTWEAPASSSVDCGLILESPICKLPPLRRTTQDILVPVRKCQATRKSELGSQGSQEPRSQGAKHRP